MKENILGFIMLITNLFFIQLSHQKPAYAPYFETDPVDQTLSFNAGNIAAMN